MSTAENESDDRKKLFAELKGELFKRQLSNSENFDKAVLAYSSAGLALSLGFLKNFVPLDKASYKCLLFSSWALFVLAVIVTIISFLISQKGISKQLKLSERYYLERDETSLTEGNAWATATEVMPFIAGLSFVAALVCTTLFVYFNV